VASLAISAATRLAGVIGWPTRHSRSPALHNAAYRAAKLDAVYLAFAVEPSRLPAALHALPALGLMGVNVTVPHKAAALEICDEVDALARAIGAVNTIVVKGGRLSGTNTDAAGFRRALDEEGAPAGRAVVLGAGGAARAVVLALLRRGHEVLVVARDVKRAAPLLASGAQEVLPWETGALAEATAGAALLVDATSAALSPEAERAVPAEIPLGSLPSDALVVSLVYHREPELLRRARARGLSTMDGGSMLVHQAAEAFTLMTGVEAPLAAMRKAL
jgi:shikimate dehydrogenase